MSLKSVWASHTGIGASWTESGASGFNYVFYFNSLSDLCHQMGDEELRGKVALLGMIAHGNDLSGGLIRLDRDLTAESISGFRSDFELLRRYLTRSAYFVIYGCNIGYLAAGSDLLKAISRRLQGSTIIGFTVWGVTSPYGSSLPGFVGYNTEPNSARSLGFLAPNDRYAKWARDGEILQLPEAERL